MQRPMPRLVNQRAVSVKVARSRSWACSVRSSPRCSSSSLGVFGPDANAHGPNEYLHVPTARKVTMAVAHLLNAHASC